MLSRAHFVHILIAASITCATSAWAQRSSPGLIPADEGGAVGYQHGLERSRFMIGVRRDALRHIEENGFEKVVGPDRIFATNVQNGLVIAIRSGGSDKGDARLEKGDETTRSIMDPDKHNRQVVDYLVTAGIPRDQIKGVHATTYLSSSGSMNDERPAPPKVDGYASVLERKIEKYPVVDSVAWARMNEDGSVVSEWVYWPAIPVKAIADARRLEELSVRTDFQTRLPAGSLSGRVVIRHSSATAEGPFEVFASYDTIERRKSPATARWQDPSTQGWISVVKHFDVDGVERQLPQERRNLGTDYPPKGPQPSQTSPAGP
jgi:hypothetical protein